MLVDLLGCEMAPVAISFADKPPKGARMFPEGKRGCVASMLLSVSRTGIVAAFDEHTTGCPGGGIGLCNKIKAYQLQDEGLDTAEANLRLGFRVDERDYGVGASIIRELGIKHMRLMTNNPLKRAGLEGYGLHIDEIVPIVIAPNKYNEHYLETKEVRMGHTLGLFKKK